MKTREAMVWARRRLAGAAIPDAALDADVLLMEASTRSRAELYAALPEPLPESALRRFEGLVDRRLHREPLAYIVGRREFFGLDLMVDSNVLVPRQETETVVERVLDLVGRSFPRGDARIADVGTGSGAIAVSLAVHLPGARILATDISRPALRVAALNSRRHGVEERVTLLLGDLLEPLDGPLDIVVANLPYIPASQWDRLQPEIRGFEPKGALVPGQDGLAAIRRLLCQIAGRAERPRWTVLEVGDGQAAAVVREAHRRFAGAHVTTFRDLQGLERGVVIEQAAAGRAE